MKRTLMFRAKRCRWKSTAAYPIYRPVNPDGLPSYYKTLYIHAPDFGGHVPEFVQVQVAWDEPPSSEAQGA